MTQRTQVISGTSYPVGYVYNQAGSVTSLTYPSTRVIQPSYDAVGRIASIANGSTNYVSAMAYNLFSTYRIHIRRRRCRKSWLLTGPVSIAYLAYSNSGTTLFSQTYSYNSSGTNNSEMTGITDNVDSGRNMAYTYDALTASQRRLVRSANYSQWGLSWTYDRYGIGSCSQLPLARRLPIQYLLTPRRII